MIEVMLVCSLNRDGVIGRGMIEVDLDLLASCDILSSQSISLDKCIIRTRID